MKETYKKLKERHPNYLILLHGKDYYITFGEDAKDVADITYITLNKKDGDYIIEFPEYEIDTWLPKLIRAGKRVALSELH